MTDKQTGWRDIAENLTTDVYTNARGSSPWAAALTKGCRTSFHAGYQHAIDTLRDLTKDYPNQAQAISLLADQLQSFKPD